LKLEKPELQFYLLGQATKFLKVIIYKMQVTISNSEVSDAQDKALEASYKLGITQMPFIVTITAAIMCWPLTENSNGDPLK
jgi:hypothetical protein